MARHLQRELDDIKRNLLTIGAMVEEALDKAILAFDQRRSDLAEEVIREDRRINHKEVEVEESCLKILALYQPVAEDLRFIAAVIRINNDLERMGDYAVSIARRAAHLAKQPIPIPADLKTLAVRAKEMVRKSLDAFVKRDAQFARQICVEDDEIDKLHHKILDEVRTIMKTRPDQIDSALDLFTTARRLERVADMATNIAQDVVYMVEGEIIRHRPEEYPR